MIHSQKVKLLVQRLYRLHDASLNCFLLLTFNFSLWLVVVLTLKRAIANEHVKLGDLVGVLAWRWNSDWTRPIEIAMAEGESQLLNLDLLQYTLVQWDKAMCGNDTALVRVGRSDEKVKGLEHHLDIAVTFARCRASMLD